MLPCQKFASMPDSECKGWGKCIFLLPFRAFLFFFQERDVVQYIHVIRCLKSLVFKWSKELQSIHCFQNYDRTVSIKRKLFALWNFAWIFNSFSLFKYSSKMLLYLKLLIRFQSVTVMSRHIMSHKYWWFISSSFVIHSLCTPLHKSIFRFSSDFFWYFPTK